ncbi:MAG: NAD-dependent epimerase/dehydratase family protein, partial [Candidatus Hodarchaeota archaeon]
MWKNRKVLVTGGASFIGSHLVDSLILNGAIVKVADDFSSGKLSNLEYPLEKVSEKKWSYDDLSIYEGNPLLTAGSDGGPIGDPRWLPFTARKVVSIGAILKRVIP